MSGVYYYCCCCLDEDLNAILQELDLIGLDLQMELDGISDVTTPPTQSRSQSRQTEPIRNLEPKLPKPEPKVSKPEPKVSNPVPIASRLELFQPSQRPQLETPAKPTVDSKNRTDPIRSKVTSSGDRVTSEQRGRTRGGRTPGGLRLSYNAENNYPESVVSCCCCCCCCCCC